jgi:3-oxoadipate enol-lactonase
MHVNNRQLAIEYAGTGPAVVFLHGIGGTSNVFQVQAEALEPAHQIVRPDFAGAGRSPVADRISIASHAEDIAAVLDTLGISRAVVVAHSMGTLVARTLAAHHPGSGGLCPQQRGAGRGGRSRTDRSHTSAPAHRRT